MLNKIVIPVAAFAVTVTAASAFNADMLEQIDVDLTDDQISALETAHKLRDEGSDRSEVKEVLEDAGLDREKMQEIREAVRGEREAKRAAVHAALESGDYEAFLAVAGDGPRAALIDTEEKFERLAEAHELREAGDREGAREIMDELGFEKPEGRGHKGGMRGGGEGRGFGQR
jgi:DNA-binding transcriptional MerR regulator